MYTHRLSVARANAPATSSTKIISSSSSCRRVLGRSGRQFPLASTCALSAIFPRIDRSLRKKKKTASSSVIVHRRVPLSGRAVTRGRYNPRGTETATPGAHRPRSADFTPVPLLRVRWTSKWHNSAPELPASSVSLRDDFDNRSVCFSVGRSTRRNCAYTWCAAIESGRTWTITPGWHSRVRSAPDPEPLPEPPSQFVADFSKEPPARLTIRLADLVVTEWVPQLRLPVTHSSSRTHYSLRPLALALSLTHRHSVPPPSLLLPPAPFRSPTVILSLPVRPPCPPTCAHATLAARSFAWGEVRRTVRWTPGRCRFH